jgi:hypothetical protein
MATERLIGLNFHVDRAEVIIPVSIDGRIDLQEVRVPQAKLREWQRQREQPADVPITLESPQLTQPSPSDS